MTIDVVGRTGPVAFEGGQTSTPLSTYSAPAVADAVPTDLPPSESVQAAPKSFALPVDDAQQAQARAATLQQTAQSFIKSKFVYDTEQELVFISVDELTGDVVQKFPNDAILRDATYQQAVVKNAGDGHLVEKVA